jgi:hypothetical protein
MSLAELPYAFAKRVMTLLQVQPVPDSRALWARALWRAAVCCLAIMLFLSAISFISSTDSTPPSDLSQDYLSQDYLTQDFEKTMLASMDPDTDSLSSR